MEVTLDSVAGGGASPEGALSTLDVTGGKEVLNNQG
jgi:hypothetical protein